MSNALDKSKKTPAVVSLRSMAEVILLTKWFKAILKSSGFSEIRTGNNIEFSYCSTKVIRRLYIILSKILEKLVNREIGL